MAEHARRKRQPHAEYLAELMRQEVIDRQERRIKRRVSEARFPVLKTLDVFDWDADHGLDREEVLELFDCRFVAERSNVVLVGEAGTGKTHLAVALGLARCQQSYRVRFVTAAELTNSLVEAKAAGRLSRVLDRTARFDVVVLGELGYAPFDKQGADLLFSFIAEVCERRSLVVTTNLAFSRWSEVLLDATAAAAVIDLIVHHAVVLQTKGKRYRLRDAKASARTPSRTRSRAASSRPGRRGGEMAPK